LAIVENAKIVHPLNRERLSSGLNMNWSDLASRLEFWGLRIGGYLLVSFIDDPAWLAFMFC
jgi:hypothetical protein